MGPPTRRPMIPPSFANQGFASASSRHALGIIYTETSSSSIPCFRAYRAINRFRSLRCSSACPRVNAKYSSCFFLASFIALYPKSPEPIAANSNHWKEGMPVFSTGFPEPPKFFNI